MSTFKGRGPVRVGHETESPLDLFIRRVIAVAGPQPAEDVAEIREAWARATPEERDRAAAMTDEELRRDLDDVEAEWDDVQEGLAGAEEPPDASVSAVLAWVDGDATKAGIALEAEQARRPPRTSLVAKLQALVDAPA